MNIEKTEQKIKRIDEDLAAARAKFEEIRIKISQLEKERETAENLRIVQIVRNTEITPEMLKQILGIQKKEAEIFVSTAVLPEIIPEIKTKKERITNYEDEETL